MNPFGYPPHIPAGKDTPPHRHDKPSSAATGTERGATCDSDGRAKPRLSRGRSATTTPASRASAANIVLPSSTMPTPCTPYREGPRNTRSPGRGEETGASTAYWSATPAGTAAPYAARTNPSHERVDRIAHRSDSLSGQNKQPIPGLGNPGLQRRQPGRKVTSIT
jgi:hypothetical protein